MLFDVMNDQSSENNTQAKNKTTTILDLILTTLSSQSKDIHSPDKLSDEVVSGIFYLSIFLSSSTS